MSIQDPYTFWRCVGDTLAKAMEAYIFTCLTGGGYPKKIIITNESFRRFYLKRCMACGNLQNKAEYLSVFDYDRQACTLFEKWVKIMNNKFSTYSYKGERIKIRYNRFRSLSEIICEIDIYDIYDREELNQVSKIIRKSFEEAWREYVLFKVSPPSETARTAPEFRSTVADFHSLMAFIDELVKGASEIRYDTSVASMIYEELMVKYSQVMSNISSDEIKQTMIMIHNIILDSVETLTLASDYLTDPEFTRILSYATTEELSKRTISLYLIDIEDAIATIKAKIEGEE